MRLMSKEDLGQVGRVSFAGKSFDSVVRFVSRFFQVFFSIITYTCDKQLQVKS